MKARAGACDAGSPSSSHHFDCTQLGIVLDPDRITDARELTDFGPIETTTDWLSLRRAYERFGRYLERGERVVFLHQEPDLRQERELPFDISRRGQVIRLRPPGPPELADLTVSLPDDELERVLRATKRRPADPVGAAVEVLAGVTLGDQCTPLDEIRAAIRLATSHEADPIRRAVRERIANPAARALLSETPDPEPLQQLWDSWLASGTRSRWHSVLAALGPELVLAHLSGLLRASPSAAESELPTWVRIGVTATSAAERVERAPRVASRAVATLGI